MKNKLFFTYSKLPIYLWLLPLFFFLHAYVNLYSPNLLRAFLTQTSKFLVISTVLFSISIWFLKSAEKAAIPPFVILAFNFFYRPIKLPLQKLLGQNSFFLKYSTTIVILFLLIILLYAGLRKYRKSLKTLSFYLNILFSIFILLDVTLLSLQFIKYHDAYKLTLQKNLLPLNNNNLPDVYVIVSDEYAGTKTLIDLFNFDNTGFEQKLRERGFYVIPRPSSNYNFTVFSMASFFNMEYLPLHGPQEVNSRDMLICRSILMNNNSGAFFKKNGYKVYNNSFFDFQKTPAPIKNYYFLPREWILNDGTFINDFQLEAGFNFFSQKKLEEVKNRNFLNDSITDNLIRQSVKEKDKSPKFVYTHFFRPHHPYFVDRNGQPFHHSESLRGFERLKIEYTEYLQYASKKNLAVIDYILKNSRKPPIIIFMSDHGFRQMYGAPGRSYDFANFCALYYPSKNYSMLPESLSLVNVLRSVLNSEFHQHLPALKDSSSFFIIEK